MGKLDASAIKQELEVVQTDLVYLITDAVRLVTKLATTQETVAYLAKRLGGGFVPPLLTEHMHDQLDAVVKAGQGFEGFGRPPAL